MSTCAKCGEVLIGSKKFCAYCGTAATATAVQPTGRASVPSAPPAVSTEVTGPPQRASGYGAPPSPQVAGARASGIPSTVQPDTNVPPPYATSFPVPFSVGTPVLVQWADGNRYPGIVQQIAPGQALVVFPDGQQRWVDHRYLERAPR